MLYKDNEGLKLSTRKIRCTESGKEIEKFIGQEGEQWWTDFAEKWTHINIIEIADVEYTQEQLERFEEVKNINANEEVLEKYVLNGEIGEDKELQILKLKKENEELKQTLADLTQVVLMGGAL